MSPRPQNASIEAHLTIPFCILLLLGGCVTSTEGDKQAPPERNVGTRDLGCDNMIGRYQAIGEPYAGNPDTSIKPNLYSVEGALQSLIAFGENRKSDEKVKSIEIQRSKSRFSFVVEMQDQAFRPIDLTSSKFRCKDGRLESKWKQWQPGVWGRETRSVMLSTSTNGHLIAENVLRESMGHLLAVVPIGTVETYRLYWRFKRL